MHGEEPYDCSLLGLNLGSWLAHAWTMPALADVYVLVASRRTFALRGPDRVGVDALCMGCTLSWLYGLYRAVLPVP